MGTNGGRLSTVQGSLLEEVGISTPIFQTTVETRTKRTGDQVGKNEAATCLQGGVG